MLRDVGCAGSTSRRFLQHWIRKLTWLVAVCTGICIGIFSLSALGLNTVHARAQPEISTAAIDVSQLPLQGRDMMALIYQGGPFRHDKDGSVFGNRERILPARQRGFYREYTVRTPGERSRGARRIVCGGVKPALPEACYYTDDHYASFRRIVH
ncbi:MAG: guanyl-specific ribonuclease [Polaromonas sp.]|nr:guanyl-specific ribonuclease [Polaromonas sp.]